MNIQLKKNKNQFHLFDNQKIILSDLVMSFIKSDSLLSNIKNVSIRIDMRPNDGSNIFKSLFSNIDQKQKSIKLQSLFDFQSNFHTGQQGNSLMDKLTNSHPKQTPSQSYHYNWIVCKNAGLSQEQDNDQIHNSQQKKQKQTFSDMKSQYKSSQQKQQIQKQYPPLNNEQKKVKNETKNIPKNYGKAIICYIQKYRKKVQKITQYYNVDYHQLLEDLKRKKKSINTIADLRNIWSKYKYAKCMRVITYLFLRKHALSYIFDSRICTYASHIKYRQRLCEAVSSPEEFKHIKDY